MLNEKKQKQIADIYWECKGCADMFDTNVSSYHNCSVCKSCDHWKEIEKFNEEETKFWEQF